MSTLELKVYDILKSKFTEAEAATVIEYFEAKAKEKIDEKADVYQTLQNKDLESLRKEMSTKVDIANLKSEILKWMVGMFIPLYLSIIGLIIAILIKH